MRKPGTGQLTYIIKVVFNEPVDGFATEDYVLVNKTDTALIPAIVPSVFTFDALTNTAVIAAITTPAISTVYKLTLTASILDESVNQNPMAVPSIYDVEFIVADPLPLSGD